MPRAVKYLPTEHDSTCFVYRKENIFARIRFLSINPAFWPKGIRSQRSIKVIIAKLYRLTWGHTQKNQSINRNLLESYIITPLRMLTFPRAFVGLRQRDADNMPSLPCNLFDTSFDLIIVLKDLIFIDSHTGKIYYTIPISNVTGPCEQFPNLWLKIE